MSPTNQTHSVSYHDIFARNGFAESLETSPKNPLSTYFKRLSDNQILIIDVFNSHWEVQLCSLTIQKRDSLDAIVHDRTDHKTVQEENDDVNRISLINLKELFKRLEIVDDLQ